MTREDFTTGIDILSDNFGQQAWPPSRIEIMWDAVSALDGRWWRQQVDNAVLSANNRYNFLDAISFEKRRRAMEKLAEEESARLGDSMTGEGFGRVLKMFKAKTIQEAIEHARPSNKGGEDDRGA